MKRWALVVALLPACSLFRGIDDPILAAAEDTGADSASADTSYEDTGSLEDSAVPEDTALPAETSVIEASVDASVDAPLEADAPACTEGAVTCAGAALQKCTGGTLATVETCATPELCAASGMGPCKMPACEVGEKRCAGKGVEKCNAGRTGYAIEVSCEVGCEGAACLTVDHLVGGASHSCALLSNGTVRCWGSNADGQLGNGTTDEKLTPNAVPALKTVVQVAAGRDHSCARLLDGTVWCWGSNFYNQIGDGAPSVSARLYPTATFLLSNAAEIGAGASLTCARIADGSVRCWGQFTKQTSPYLLSGVHKVPTDLGLTDVQQIAVGSYHACALKKDATVWCWWGSNGAGEHGDTTANPSETPTKASIAGVKQLAAGNRFTCGLLSDGTVKCWGDLFGDSTKRYGATPVTIAGLSGVSSIVAKGQTVCVQLSGGGARCWGTNEFGAVGDGSKVERATPVEPTALATVLSGRQLALGWFHTMVYGSAGSYGLGLNDAGQVGDGKKGGEYLAPQLVNW